ncbi:hypothetical protein ACIQGT_40320 [Streptomyces sp. NPDC093108]|uniref:hypothetical protein n=1 Tax=Streptomyces sp. NPDC093108 TaxID=3366030 RepID=UPI00381D3CF2
MTDTPQTALDTLRGLALRSADGPTVQQLLDDVTTELTDRTVVHRDQDRRPRRFVLRRSVDVSGISGLGDVADGVLWPDGTASVRWRGEHPSSVFWDRGRASVELIHGHRGATSVVFLDAADELAGPVPGVEAVPLALRRAVDRALNAPVACSGCGRTIACPCSSDRREGRVDAILAALAPWIAPDNRAAIPSQTDRT